MPKLAPGVKSKAELVEEYVKAHHYERGAKTKAMKMKKAQLERSLSSTRRSPKRRSASPSRSTSMSSPRLSTRKAPSMTNEDLKRELAKDGLKTSGSRSTLLNRYRSKKGPARTASPGLSTRKAPSATKEDLQKELGKHDLKTSGKREILLDRFRRFHEDDLYPSDYTDQGIRKVLGCRKSDPEHCVTTTTTRELKKIEKCDKSPTCDVTSEKIHEALREAGLKTSSGGRSLPKNKAKARLKKPRVSHHKKAGNRSARGPRRS